MISLQLYAIQLMLLIIIFSHTITPFRIEFVTSILIGLHQMLNLHEIIINYIKKLIYFDSLKF